eukprot:TRINITY_DN47995_c0_g1_i1.p1 TRINITY_DN47995_c0_g1~~TRINITY_DN47995_c0_g1_i1.p1  ORF type:complete len:108 (-),score=8.16 TRINITY_DN47995_c0_g1_i1:80-403(-)
MCNEVACRDNCVDVALAHSHTQRQPPTSADNQTNSDEKQRQRINSECQSLRQRLGGTQAALPTRSFPHPQKPCRTAAPPCTFRPPAAQSSRSSGFCLLYTSPSPRDS